MLFLPKPKKKRMLSDQILRKKKKRRLADELRRKSKSSLENQKSKKSE
jgi:hypothetical protein